MFVIAGALLGAVTGYTLAHRRKGQPLDKAQYATAFAILFMIIGLFITLFIHRSAL